MHQFRRLVNTMTAFPGLTGIRWIASVCRGKDVVANEELSPREAADPETLFLPGEYADTAYREMGAGNTAVMLIPGFGSRLQTWAQVQPALADRYRTIALDLWGFGASSRPPALTPRDWSRQLAEAMDALGIDSAVLVAHSLGGRVPIAFAAEFPHRVRGIVLVDADWGQLRYGYLLVWALAQSPLVPWLLRRLRGNPAHLLRLMQIAYARDFRLDDALVASYQRPLRVIGTAACWLHLFRVRPTEHRLHALLRSLHCPVQILWGAEDRIIPVDWSAPLRDLLQQAELTVIPGAGHMPQEEDPTVVTDLIRGFLENID